MTDTVPAWLTRPELGLCPCGCAGKRRKGSFVEKTLTGGAAVMRRAMFSADVAAGDGLLQRVDARVKVVTVLGVLVAAALARSPLVLAGLYLLTVGAAAASGLAVGFFVRRVWLFVPIFTGIVVLPATLDVVTPGHVVAALGPVGITSQGLGAAALIVTRVAVSISLVVLLTLTTPWAKLLAALRALLVPRMFIQVIGMAYRYVFHLLGSVDDMYTARKARTVGGQGDGRAFVAASAGALFGKAHALSDEVHMAMVSRGYTGNARSLDRPRVGRAEIAWAVGCLVAAAATIGVDRVIAR